MKSEPAPGQHLRGEPAHEEDDERGWCRRTRRVAAPESPAVIAKMTAICARHGTPSARRSVTITRSFRVSMIRAVMVAMVSQPRPSTIGSTALPFSPIRLKTLFTITASRGR